MIDSDASINEIDRWLQPGPPSGTMVAYVQGYILALEDMLKDWHRCLSLSELLIKLEQSHQEARQTLETIARLWPQSLHDLTYEQPSPPQT